MTDKINTEYIKENITYPAQITFYECTDSTNLRLKEEAKNEAITGRVIIAENQTSGRGRLGRQFFSPSHSGIYMSLLMKPDSQTDIGLITAYTAVAVCEALETVCQADFEIKWVNDILKEGKKVCGILAEAGSSSGKTDYIIVGIGINVYPPEGGFPDEIKDIASSVLSSTKENARNKIISEIINRFYSPSKDFISEYKRRSAVIGERIHVHKAGEVKKAVALDIEDNCNLKVEYENGETESLSFGEISIRKA